MVLTALSQTPWQVRRGTPPLTQNPVSAPGLSSCNKELCLHLVSPQVGIEYLSGTLVSTMRGHCDRQQEELLTGGG